MRICREAKLAGCTLTILVETGWTRVMVDGVEAKRPVALRRDAEAYDVRFVREPTRSADVS
jgi:hypothetical protein